MFEYPQSPQYQPQSFYPAYPAYPVGPIPMPPVRPPKPVGYLIGIAVAVAVAVAALDICGFLGWKLRQERQTQARERATQQQLHQDTEQGHKAAASFAQLLSSTDYKKVDENFAQVLDGATGKFKESYSKSAAQLRQFMVDNKAMAHGEVLDSAVESEADRKVVVLLFVDQTVTNTVTPQARVDKSRLKITMEKVGDRWLASDVELP